MNIRCEFCGWIGQNSEFKKGICPKCNNETKSEKHLKSIADSLSQILEVLKKGGFKNGKSVGV